MENPRLVVIDTLKDGTSCVAKDEAITPFWRLADGHTTSELWFSRQFPPLAIEDNAFQEVFDFNLAPGEIRFGHSTFPPFSQVQTCAADPLTYGKHSTTTLDFAVVTKGCLDLVTENGTVHLNVGDCIVQKATVHAWMNPGDEVAELVYVMVGAIVPEGFKPVATKPPAPAQVNYP